MRFHFSLACPDQMDRVDEMMAEYQGREEVLIGHLSTMLASKNRLSNDSDHLRDSSSASETDDEGRRSLLSDYTHSSGNSTSLNVSTQSGSGRSLLTSSFNDQSNMSLRDSESSSGHRETSESETTTDEAIRAAGMLASAAISAANKESVTSKKSAASELSSSAGSSEWSSDDGMSSVDASSLNTNDIEEQELLRLTSIEGQTRAVSGYPGSSKPTFVPVDNGSGRSSDEEDDGLAQQTASRLDLDAAIQAGDWKAVGATAALIAGNPDLNESADSADALNLSTLSDAFSATSVEKKQVRELEQLVETGDWKAVMAAASRYEKGEDDGIAGNGGQSSSSGSTSSGSKHSVDPDPSPRTSEELSEIRDDIAELVETIVPDELDNLDDMLLQYRGREEELLNLLRTMRVDNTGEEEIAAQLNSSNSSNHDDGSRVSIFESDRDSITENTGSEEGKREKLSICSRCSKHLPQSEFDGGRLETIEEAGICRECMVLMS